jgi:hypothetical protein
VRNHGSHPWIKSLSYGTLLRNTGAISHANRDRHEALRLGSSISVCFFSFAQMAAFYAVWSPKKPEIQGIYDAPWSSVERVTKGVSNAVPTKHGTRHAAETWLRTKLGLPLDAVIPWHGRVDPPPSLPPAHSAAGSAGGTRAALPPPSPPALAQAVELRVGAGRVKLLRTGTTVERSASLVHFVAPSGAQCWTARLVLGHGQPKAAALALLAVVLQRVRGARVRIVTSSQHLLDMVGSAVKPRSAATRRLHNGFQSALKLVTMVAPMSLAATAPTVESEHFACALDTVAFSDGYASPPPPRAPKRPRSVAEADG